MFSSSWRVSEASATLYKEELTMTDTIYFIRQEYIRRFFPELWDEARNLDYDGLRKLVQEVMNNGEK